MKNPKAFISYSWTSPEHAEWVIRLATELRENGVDIVLDKWDLREGHDAVKFMEKMVTDPEIGKVIIVLDSGYVHKADSRKGGVGTETQIISAEVYSKSDQNKFVAVLSERDPEGRPFLPVYLKSRIWIDLSSSEEYSSNFEKLLRWIYGKPVDVKPDLGKVPEFLNDEGVHLPTHSRARRAIEQLRNTSPSAPGALDEYFELLGDELERLRIVPDQTVPFDEKVVTSIEAFIPARNEYVDVILSLTRQWNIPSPEARIHKFLERASLYLFKPPSVSSWTDEQFDNFCFIVHELFLYTIAALLKFERFDAVQYLLTQQYYIGSTALSRSNPMEDYRVFRPYLRSLQRRNERLKLKRTSLHADLLEQRAKLSTVPFRALMQADFLIFLYSSVDALKEKGGNQWHPVTLLYSERHSGPFELFARAQSNTYLRRILDFLGLRDKDELNNVISKMGDVNAGAPLHLPRWQFMMLDVSGLVGLDLLGRRD